MTDMSAKRFTNQTEARKHLEAVRWPDGPPSKEKLKSVGEPDLVSDVRARPAPMIASIEEPSVIIINKGNDNTNIVGSGNTVSEGASK